MKPVAPTLHAAEQASDSPTLQSEIRRLCDTKASDDRSTTPAPPSADVLRAATPVPAHGPQQDGEAPDTMPSPPPSATGRRDGSQPELDALSATIPRPPRVPRFTL